jgi:hypothetical protein
VPIAAIVAGRHQAWRRRFARVAAHAEWIAGVTMLVKIEVHEPAVAEAARTFTRGSAFESIGQ